jgi:hypothetical protein
MEINALPNKRCLARQHIHRSQFQMVFADWRTALSSVSSSGGPSTRVSNEVVQHRFMHVFVTRPESLQPNDMKPRRSATGETSKKLI